MRTPLVPKHPVVYASPVNCPLETALTLLLKVNVKFVKVNWQLSHAYMNMDIVPKTPQM